MAITRREVTGRRLKQVSIAAELLIDLLAVGDVTDAAIRLQCVKGLPQDARLIGVKHDAWTRTLDLMFEHSGFEIVPSNERPPNLECQFTKTDLRAVEQVAMLPE
jgi:hypothetical protein